MTPGPQPCPAAAVESDDRWRTRRRPGCEPDVVVFDRAKGLAGLSGEEVFPVVEIADSSLRYDIGRKAALYASFGVRELWVIDAVRLVTHLFRAPTAEGYGEARDLSANEHLTPQVAPEAFALRPVDLAIE